jgi:hypothetical protein
MVVPFLALFDMFHAYQGALPGGYLTDVRVEMPAWALPGGGLPHDRRMASRSRAWVWTGIGLFVAGAVGLVVGGLLDVDAADPWASVAGGTAGLLGLALTVKAIRENGRGRSSPHLAR